MLKNFIRKLLRESMEVMDEATYPESFNMEEFKRLPTFKDRIKYAKERLEKLGEGSSRIVYKIDDVTVLKLAKNKKGVAQNKLEIEYSKDSYLQNIVAEVYESMDNGNWLEMELAVKLKETTFKNIVGVSFKDYVSALRYYYFTNIKPSKFGGYSKPENYKELWENEFAYDMFNFVGNYGIPVGDLSRLSTYGIVKRDDKDAIVMIDYGLNDDVYNDFYKR